MSINSQFLLAGVSSGSGKTTLTLGLLRALHRRSLKVQPFKCGPDYIDTQFHEVASSMPSINLDTFLMSRDYVHSLYGAYRSVSDVCVTEGVMGMFDGYDRMKGSSADIAQLLQIPVVLVVNAASMAYSAAAIIYGFKNLCPEVNVVGVIFNFVSSATHYSYLQDACADTGVEALGYLPKDMNMSIPSRHLGLNTDAKTTDGLIETIAQKVEQYIRIDRLLELTSFSPLKEQQIKTKATLHDCVIAVAKDEAFNFVYHENIKYLHSIGKVIYFSPVKDKCLPDADYVYIPGGYPEAFVKELSENESMRMSIKNYCENGGKLLAECGGMMYLCQSLIDASGIEYPMVGIFDEKASMQQMKLSLGYRCFDYNCVPMKGHEFHYSQISGNEASVVKQFNAKSMEVKTKLMRFKNTVAGYTHLYWAENKSFKKFFE